MIVEVTPETTAAGMIVGAEMTVTACVEMIVGAEMTVTVCVEMTATGAEMTVVGVEMTATGVAMTVSVEMTVTGVGMTVVCVAMNVSVAMGVGISVVVGELEAAGGAQQEEILKTENPHPLTRPPLVVTVMRRKIARVIHAP